MDHTDKIGLIAVNELRSMARYAKYLMSRIFGSKASGIVRPLGGALRHRTLLFVLFAGYVLGSLHATPRETKRVIEDTAKTTASSGDTSARIPQEEPDSQEATAESKQVVEDSKVEPEKDAEKDAEKEAVTEQDEVCLPVIKVLVRRRENAEVAKLRRDIREGEFKQVAVDIRTTTRLKDQPKIMVPVSADRYRVWYGYHSGIRASVLRTAVEYAGLLPSNGLSTSSQTEKTSSIKDSVDDSTDQQLLDGEERKEGIREGGYPTRTSWWTVGKKHPEKEGMVTHLSGGPHKNKFDLAWLETLTRDELHSLHSDDHEDKVNWVYAQKPVEPPASESGEEVQERDSKEPTEQASSAALSLVE